MTVSAGIWHNLVLSIIAISLLIASPLLLSPFYHIRADGVTVLGVNKILSPSLASSPLLHIGDRITAVDGNIISSVSDWQSLLLNISNSPNSHPDGRCMSTSLLSDTARILDSLTTTWQQTKGERTWQQVADEVTERKEAASSLKQSMKRGAVGSPFDNPDRLLLSNEDEVYTNEMIAFSCCIPELSHLSSLTCFAYNTSHIPSQQYNLCLEPKQLITSLSTLCHQNADCTSSPTDSSPYTPSPSFAESLSCASPVLFDPSFHLFVISRTAVSPLSSSVGSSHGELRWIGSVHELYSAMELSDDVMRGWLMFSTSSFPAVFVFFVRLPVMLSPLFRLLQFIIAVSSSLFILNALPIPRADGEHAVLLLASIARDVKLKSWRYSRIVRWMVRMTGDLCEEENVRWFGKVCSVLFIANVALSFVPIVRYIVSQLQ
jgi:hypothetical protein